MKKRILIALVVCMSVVATFAASASAATANEKIAKFKACMASPPAQLMKGQPSAYQLCCLNSGGVLAKLVDGTEACTFTSDRPPTDSVLAPYDPGTIVIRP
jgi:hypothetical protein